ncbi:MAG: DUF6804 family protein [Phycisphaerales bacterium]
MPRWSLVVLAIAAALLAAVPLGFIPGSYELGARWVVAGGFVLGAIVAGKQQSAVWCGLFAAFAVLFQPAFPVDLKQFTMYASIGAAVLTAVCVVREW